MNTIRELMNMFVEGDFQEISLYDIETSKTLFEGVYCDMPEKYYDWYIYNVDNLTDNSILIINVDSSSEE